MALFPFAVILQVTPIVAIAPLILIYVASTQTALLLCAWIVAFFPILSNTTLGPELASTTICSTCSSSTAPARWQQLRLPQAAGRAALFPRRPAIAGGLALIGAVVAEFAAGSAGAGSGLAFRILEAGYRLNIPRLFAALILLSLTGIVIFFVLSLISHLLLRRWHESALQGER